MELDPAAPFPELLTLREAVAAGDWSSVSASLGDITNPNDLQYAAAIVIEVPDAEKLLEEAAARDTSSTLARTLYAARLTILGWDVRSHALAKYVSPEQFAAFHDHLRRAERILIDVTAEDPANALAWAYRLRTARGLELGHSEARRRYARLAAHTPHHYDGQFQLLQQLCPKWSGSFQVMHEFALECMRAAPAGAPNGAMVAAGHIEHWVSLDTDSSAAAYMARPEVKRELREAAERSVLHPSFAGGYRSISVHNIFALTASLTGDYAAAATHFRAVGRYASQFPWVSFAEPRRLFEVHRARAMQKG